MGTVAASVPVALVLEVDPDLGAGVWPEDWEAALHACRGQLVLVPRGRWRDPPVADERDDLAGLLIVEGMMCREVGLPGHSMLELLGPGDVFQLPLAIGRHRLGGRVELTALSDVALVVLGEQFIRAAGRWPSLLTTVQRRLETQRENFAIQALIAHLSRADFRLLLMLRHLAERWGFVTPDGIVLPIVLTHDLLGQLIGTQRPTATLALGALESDGSVRRLEDGSWLLTAAAERKIDTLIRTSAAPPVQGERLMLGGLISKTGAEPVAPHA